MKKYEYVSMFRFWLNFGKKPFDFLGLLDDFAFTASCKLWIFELKLKRGKRGWRGRQHTIHNFISKLEKIWLGAMSEKINEVIFCSCSFSTNICLHLAKIFVRDMNIWWWSPQIQWLSPQIHYTEITHDWALLWISALTKLTGWSKWLMWSMDSVNNTNQNWNVFVQIAKNYYILQYVHICTKLTGWSKWLMWSVSALVRSLTQLKSEMYLSTIWFCKMYLSKVQTVFVQNWLMWSMVWVNNSTQKWPSHLTACVTSQWCPVYE